ncbi:MAG: hypothetical protein J6U34_06000, partial [Bacteroidales bacterium]|nr:hypothetical protein [Bacteroidales bacterium]
ILLTLEARFFPLAGKTAFFPAEYLAQQSLAGKSAFFPAERLSQHCSGRENSLFSGRTPLAALLWPGKPGVSGMGGQNITKGGVFLH